MHINQASNEFLEGYFSTNERRTKTQNAYHSDLKQFQAFVGSKSDFLLLRSNDIEKWAAHLKQKGYSPASIRRKMVILKVFFTYWVRQGILSESPFWRVKLSFGRIVQLPRTLTEGEMKGLLEQALQNYSLLKAEENEAGFIKAKSSSRNYRFLRNLVILELMFATGIRVGEISSIDMKDFHPKEAIFKVHGKGGRERLAFIVDECAIEILREYISARNQIETACPALFLNAAGGRLSPQGIANMLTQIRQDKGIDRHVTPHMLRHTVATLLLRNGVDIRVVQEFLGHASIATTQRYTHITKEHMVRELRHRHPSFSFRSGSPFGQGQPDANGVLNKQT
ncbi:MAG TPA: tyrosine-type recombinase/integrase [Pyrinomonadaceae bacterium]|jgi:integrase/recombinase XerD|nr:tyrosine-type recombinase/integrase [Pyrinomonadaceae bacterium]